MIRIEHLTARYGQFTALGGVTMTVSPGDIYGLVGPNGAGKTTLLRCLATLHHDFSGRILIGGVDAAADPLKAQAKFGYMPDFFGTYDGLRVWEYLDFFARARNIPDRPAAARNVLEQVGLTEKHDSPVEGLSRGMQQRLGLAQLLLHEPDLLLLDEPASGLDPRARIEVFQLLRTFAAAGRTILISSHILQELSGFCTRIAIIEKGALVADGSVPDIQRRLVGERQYLLRAPEQRLEAARQAILAAVPGAALTGAGADRLRLIIPENVSLNVILSALIAADIEILEARKEEADLQSVFLALTRGDTQ